MCSEAASSVVPVARVLLFLVTISLVTVCPVSPGHFLSVSQNKIAQNAHFARDDPIWPTFIAHISKMPKCHTTGFESEASRGQVRCWIRYTTSLVGLEQSEKYQAMKSLAPAKN